MGFYYEDVLTELQRSGVRFVLVGGVAVVLHGVPRTTVDLDLAVDLSEGNLTHLVNAMERLGYVPRAPVAAADLPFAEKRRAWIEEKGMLAFTFVRPGGTFEEVDVLIESPIAFADLERGAERIQAGAVVLPVASIDDLIRLKQRAGRAQDLSDVDALRRLVEARRG